MPIHPDHALSPTIGTAAAVRISWGLMQIPVRLHVASDEARSVPARSMFTVDGAPIGNMRYDKHTAAAYDGPIVKKAQVGPEWVVVSDEELEALSTTTKGLAEIVGFVPLTAFDTLYLTEKVAWWTPDTIKVGTTKVVDPAGAKAVALLRSAMGDRQVAALVYVPSKAGGQYVALMPNGQARYLAFAESVRAVADTAAEVTVSDAELQLAGKLIDAIGVSTPVLTDEAGARIRSYLAAKATGRVDAPVVATPAAPAADIMSALAASVAAATKPAPAKPAAAKKAKKAS